MYCLWALIGLADCLLFYVRFSDQGIVYRNWWGRTRSYTYDQVARFDEPLLRGGVKIIFADGKGRPRWVDPMAIQYKRFCTNIRPTP